MRAVQYRILTKILNEIEVPDYVYAFEKGKNIPTMARAHVGKGTVISIDLKDFFTSIKQRHLQQLFENLGFGDKPAKTLSELCTYEAFVPQGALTSPKISNLITAHTFGPELKAYCDEHGLSLTIYADDITISSNDDLVKAGGYGATMEIISFVSQLVASYGFRVNRKKTKVMRPHQRQYVCGVVVNQRVNLQKSERNILKAIVHNTRINGVANEAAKTGLTPDEFVSKTMGRLNWFGQLNPEAGVRLKSTFREILSIEHIGQDGAEVETADVPNTVQFSEATSEAASV
jgi:RNA-directed DNA polymerase